MKDLKIIKIIKYNKHMMNDYVLFTLRNSNASLNPEGI